MNTDYLDIVFTSCEIQTIYIHATFTMANKYFMCLMLMQLKVTRNPLFRSSI